MSIANTLSSNDFKLFVNTSKEGINIKNISNNEYLTLQSNSIDEYKIILPSNVNVGVNAVLRILNIVGNEIYLEWLPCDVTPPDFSTINCTILNANNEVNTIQLQISSETPFAKVNTQFIQPNNFNPLSFDVILVFPNSFFEIVDATNSAVKITLDGLEQKLGYVKSLPLFETEVTKIKQLQVANETGQQTIISPSEFQTNTIDLIWPSTRPVVSQYLRARNSQQLEWATPEGIFGAIGRVYNYAETTPSYLTAQPADSLSFNFSLDLGVVNPNAVYRFDLSVLFSNIGTATVTDFYYELRNVFGTKLTSAPTIWRAPKFIPAEGDSSSISASNYNHTITAYYYNLPIGLQTLNAFFYSETQGAFIHNFEITRWDCTVQTVGVYLP